MPPRLASTLRPLAMLLLLQAAASAPARAADDAGAPISSDDPRTLHALGFYGRGLFVPQFLLDLGLQASQALNSGAMGLSYTRRKGTLDIVTTLDFSFFSPPDGNFLG